MLMIEFSTPLREIVRKYVSTTSLNEAKVIVEALRAMACDELFRVEQATHITSDCECTPL